MSIDIMRETGDFVSNLDVTVSHPARCCKKAKQRIKKRSKCLDTKNIIVTFGTEYRYTENVVTLDFVEKTHALSLP